MIISETIPRGIAENFGPSIINEAPESPQTMFEKIVDCVSERSEAMVGKGSSRYDVCGSSLAGGGYWYF